jgi:hypothetical protein
MTKIVNAFTAKGKSKNSKHLSASAKKQRELKL